MKELGYRPDKLVEKRNCTIEIIGAPSFYGDEFWSLRHAFVYGKEKFIGISLGYPHIMHNFMDDAHMFVNAYNLAPETQKAFVQGVFGDIPFVGKSPVELDS